MADRVSVIIPTLNESKYLPGLLNALQRQTRPPDEVIVADAGSTDGTGDIACAHNARVVRGGRPGVGRNAGALAAVGDVFVFFDADVLPRADFMERALAGFMYERLDVATCPVEALDGDPAYQIICEATNLYLRVLAALSPRAPGFCIFVRRALHQAIGGFDESLRLSEDHDYVQRASYDGKFGVLAGVTIPVSMRRLQKEGIVRLALKYLWCELYALAGKPVRATPFEYEFGVYQSEPLSKGLLLTDVGSLRKALGYYRNPLQRLSAKGKEQLHQLALLEPLDMTRDRFRVFLEHRDVDTLNQYLKRRLALANHLRKSGGRRSGKPNAPIAESIRQHEAGSAQVQQPSQRSRRDEKRDE